MICPTCGTHIPDGSLRCPACHASTGLTVAMPVLQGRWCPSCGAGVGWQDEVCPSCGLPLERVWGSPVPDEVRPPVEVVELAADESPSLDVPADDASDTRVLPRIESAIPPEDDPESKVVAQEDIPHTGRFLLAAAASAALVCGLALAITHPWDPDAYSIRATEEADTSMAGFPGTVERLSGQDSDGSPVEVLSGDDATLAQLGEAYEKLGRLAARADESEALFLQVGLEGDAEARQQGWREAEALAIDISNLISELQQTDVSSGAYADERDHLLTLGNWLRNRVDALRTAWDASARSERPSSERERIEALLHADAGADGKNAYQRLFEDNYDAWEPVRREG